MSRYLLFLVNQLCFLRVTPYSVCDSLNEICRFLKGDIYAYGASSGFVLSYLSLDAAASAAI